MFHLVRITMRSVVAFVPLCLATASGFMIRSSVRMVDQSQGGETSCSRPTELARRVLAAVPTSLALAVVLFIVYPTPQSSGFPQRNTLLRENMTRPKEKIVKLTLSFLGRASYSTAAFSPLGVLAAG